MQANIVWVGTGRRSVRVTTSRLIRLIHARGWLLGRWWGLNWLWNGLLLLRIWLQQRGIAQRGRRGRSLLRRHRLHRLLLRHRLLLWHHWLLLCWSPYSLQGIRDVTPLSGRR